MTGELPQALNGHSGSVESVSFSADGQLLTSRLYDQKVRLWYTAIGTLHQTLHGHQVSVKSVAFSTNGRLLASASSDTTVRLSEFQ